jgi:hypothetical protein
VANRRRRSRSGGGRRSDRAATHIPLEFALRAWRHDEDSGRPLLRTRAATDLFTIRAYRAGDGEPYNIDIEEYNEAASRLATFRDLAAFLALTPEELVSAWQRRGLPEHWLPEDFDDEIPDPYCFLDELDDLVPVATLADLLAEIPDRFELAPGDLERLSVPGSPALPHPLGEVVVTYGVRPGDNTKYYEVPTSLGLACLQFMLDSGGAKAIVKVDETAA